MYCKYLILFDDVVKLPQRADLISKAWGERNPVSFFQSDEDLNKATFLDVSINKWEVNPKWSDEYDVAPLVRIEILRGSAVKDFTSENHIIVPSDTLSALVFSLDDGYKNIDILLLTRLVYEIKNFIECIVYGCNSLPYQEINPDTFFDKLPGIRDLNANILNCISNCSLQS